MRARATEPESREIWLLKDGRLIGGCVAVDTDEGWIEVMRFVPGEPRPRPGILGSDFAVDRLRMVPEIRRDPPPRRDWAYWTGEGWIDEENRLIEGPMTEILDG